MKSIRCAVLAVAMAFGGLQAMALSLSDLNGSLQWASGANSPIMAYPDSDVAKSWSHATTSLSWDITFDADTKLWSYSYIWQIGKNEKALSHIIFEISTGATAADFQNIPSGSIGTYSATTQGKSNPGMPGSMYGIKFDVGDTMDSTGDSTLQYAITFLSSRFPTWGDFYAKSGNNGGGTYAYNAGFLDTDANDGMHILVPDTGTGPGPWPWPNPEPTPDAGSTVSLIGLALLGIEGLRRRLA